MIALCAVISTFCAVMLLRGFARRRVNRLFWVALCFVALSIENMLVFVDLVLLPNVDLALLRYVVAILGMVFLSFAFFEREVEQ